MTERDRERRVAVVCSECESAYAARQDPDGTIRIIGRPGGCNCENAEFRVVTENQTETEAGAAATPEAGGADPGADRS